MPATLQAPTQLDPLAAMLAEIDAGAPATVAKYDKKNPPVIHAPQLREKENRFTILKANQKDVEAELDGIKKDFIEIAAPQQLALSRKYGCHVTTVKVNGLKVQCDPPHYTTAIKGAPRIREVAALFGPLFPRAFALSYVIPETPEVVAALKAAGVAYEVQCQPTRWLHEARSTDAAVEAMLAQVTEIRPLWKVLE